MALSKTDKIEDKTDDKNQGPVSDIARLDQFYHSEMGHLVSYFLRKQVQPQLRLDSAIDRLGFGYPFMLLPKMTLPVLVPSEMGALAYGPPDGVMTASIHSHAWPIATDSVNQIIIAHGLEYCHDGEACLSEANRVLASAGEIVLIVPNRRSLWVRDERTPLGHGRPFSKSQITKLLTKTGFTITNVGRALFTPPFAMHAPNRVARAMDHLGHYGWGLFGGVMVIHATKLRYAKKPKGRGALMVSLSSALRPSVRPVAKTGSFVAYNRDDITQG